MLITGGSSGIGLALGRRLAREGAHVCIAARNLERLEVAVSLLRREARSADQMLSAVELDLTSPESVARATSRALEQLGCIDLLVNNAGYSVPGYIEAVDEAVCREMLEVNYLGPVRVVRHLLPHFVERRGGHIVNVTSMLGFMGTFGYAAYCGSKYALSGFTECLRQDVLPFGIRVHLCYPPTTRTPGLDREQATKPPETWAIEGSSHTFEPDEVAAAILLGVRRNRFHILVGLGSRWIWLAQRLAPWLVRFVTDGILTKHLRKHAVAPAQATLRPAPSVVSDEKGDGVRGCTAGGAAGNSSAEGGRGSERGG